MFTNLNTTNFEMKMQFVKRYTFILLQLNFGYEKTNED